MSSKGIIGVGIAMGIGRIAVTFGRGGYAVREPSIEYSINGFDIDSDSDPDAEEK